MGKQGARGFSLVSAIFLLVVLAGLGTAMINMSSTQHTSSALDVQGAQAYQAARSGIEWGVFRLLRPPTAGTYCSNPSEPVVTDSFTFPAGTSLSAFTVTVVCRYSAAVVTGSVATTDLQAGLGVATVTTAAPHNLFPGYQVTVSGVSPAAYNGSFVVAEVPNATTFRYALPGVDVPATVQGNVAGRAQALDRWRIRATACNQPTAGACVDNDTGGNTYFVLRMLEVEI